MKRALSHRSADTFVLASSEKMGAVSPHRVVGWDAVTAVQKMAAVVLGQSVSKNYIMPLPSVAVTNLPL